MVDLSFLLLEMWDSPCFYYVLLTYWSFSLLFKQWHSFNSTIIQRGPIFKHGLWLPEFEPLQILIKAKIMSSGERKCWQCLDFFCLTSNSTFSPLFYSFIFRFGKCKQTPTKNRESDQSAVMTVMPSLRFREACHDGWLTNELITLGPSSWFT